MRHLTYLFSLLISLNCIGQTKFKIKEVETKNWKSIYYIVDEKGKMIKELDSAKYITYMDYDFEYKYFTIFLIKGEKGWCAIDKDENILFKVYNTSFGEPSPDKLVDNKIRIVDSNDKIGFADYKGNIIIRPQFEIATSFYKDKAIIGEICEKIPWNEHAKESDCHHYSIVCKKYGYINNKGEIVEIGNYKFEEIQKKIEWKVAE